MRQNRLIAIMVGALLLTCMAGYGQRKLEIPNEFTALAFEGPFQVELIPTSNVCSVQIELHGSISSKRLNWSVKDGVLRCSLRTGALEGRSYARVVAYYKELSGIELQGATVTSRDVVRGQSLNIHTAGAKNSVTLELDVRNLDVRAVGNSTISLLGKADYTILKAYAGASIEALSLNCIQIEAVANQGAEISLRASDRLEAKASASGTIYYLGTPYINTRTSIGGKVIAIEPQVEVEPDDATKTPQNEDVNAESSPSSGANSSNEESQTEIMERFE